MNEGCARGSASRAQERREKDGLVWRVEGRVSGKRRDLLGSERALENY